MPTTPKQIMFQKGTGGTMLLFDTGKKLEKAFTAEQFAALVEVLEKRDDQLATTADVVGAKAELQQETRSSRADLRETELRLQAEIKATELNLQKEIETVRGEIKSIELRLLKWQIGGFVGLAVIMAKGFGWIGF